MGGEGERAVNLGGGGLLPPRRGWTPGAEALLHRPAATCGLSVLEQPQGMSHWPVHQCAFSRTAAAPETANTGSYYYKDFFYGKGRCSATARKLLCDVWMSGGNLNEGRGRRVRCSINSFLLIYEIMIRCFALVNRA